MKETKTINVTNCYRRERFITLCEELEKGERVHISVSCFGSTRSAMVEDQYVEELTKKYGDRLCITGRKYFWDSAYFLKTNKTHKFIAIPAHISHDCDHMIIETPDGADLDYIYKMPDWWQIRDRVCTKRSEWADLKKDIPEITGFKSFCKAWDELTKKYN